MNKSSLVNIDIAGWLFTDEGCCCSSCSQLRYRQWELDREKTALFDATQRWQEELALDHIHAILTELREFNWACTGE